MEHLAQAAGYDIRFYNVSQEEMIDASITSFNCDYAKMTEIFKRI